MKRFAELSETELLNFTADELNDSIKLEAIHQGIAPPVSLSEAIQKSGFTGHVPLKDDVAIYRLGTDGYSNDVGWLSEEAALMAMAGAVALESTYTHGMSGVQIATKQTVLVKRVILPGEAQTYKLAKLDEYVAPNESAKAFGELAETCYEIARSHRQAAYNRQVATERRAEYMRLANGDVQVAMAFWAKAETLAWPVDVEVHDA
jgi:hypothetical protein